MDGQAGVALVVAQVRLPELVRLAAGEIELGRVADSERGAVREPEVPAAGGRRPAPREARERDARGDEGRPARRRGLVDPQRSDAVPAEPVEGAGARRGGRGVRSQARREERREKRESRDDPAPAARGSRGQTQILAAFGRKGKKGIENPPARADDGKAA